MIKTCRNCNIQFEITEEDLKFYDKISPVFPSTSLKTGVEIKHQIPTPTLCPDCRQQRRLAWRNERFLYKNTCIKTGKKIVSSVSPDKEYKVIHQDEWWKDDCDNLKYSMDFDFSLSFFEQFGILFKKVPRPALHVLGNENSPYINQCGYSKKCHLCFDTDYSEDCLYCSDVTHSRNLVDVLFADKSELSYDSIDIKNCYKAIGCSQCKNSNNILFSYNLRGCSDCFGCNNLRNKKYCFYNKELSKEEYFEKLKGEFLGSSTKYREIKENSILHKLKYPHRALDILNGENVKGNYIENSRNLNHCYEVFDCEDVSYSSGVAHLKNSCDFDIGGYDCEYTYEVVSSGASNYMDCFGMNHWGNDSYLLYCDIMVSCKNCFACIGLRNKKYCVLNKQYTKEEYEILVPKIIEHMEQTGEFGEFFPVKISPFAYNETVANEYFPLTKEEALTKGYKWKESEEKEYQLQTYKVPDSIADVSDDICEQILQCEISKKNFKIIPQELKFYREMNLPIPKLCPDQRHEDQLKLRNPKKLWKRNCDKCGKEIETTYDPNRLEIVYCEECYLGTVH